ncbi:MAG: hypothetical protein M1819_000377 [Sarea resinae]|nr:MAG: hypothetical protein M1819_000377 [Sarea resinae]
MSGSYDPRFRQAYSASPAYNAYNQDPDTRNRSPYAPPAPTQRYQSAPPSGPKYNNAEMASFQPPPYAQQQQQQQPAGPNPSYYPPPSQYEHRNRFPSYNPPGSGTPHYYQPPTPDWDADDASDYSSTSSHGGKRSHRRSRRRRRHSDTDRDRDYDRNDDDGPDDDKDRGNPAGTHDPFWEVRGPGPADGVRGMGAVIAGGAAGYWAGHKKGHGLLGAVGGALAAELLEHEYKKHRHRSRRLSQ